MALFRRAWREKAFLLALVVGAILRLHQLGEQILTDDEWHALNRLRDHSYAEIVRDLGLSDFCIPLTLFYKAAADTIGLSEWIMRAPVLLCGLISLVVFPWLVRRYHGPAVGTALAWLMAISPIQIYYSRFARPYSVSLFCAFVGAVAFYQWWTTGRRAWCALYAACAIVGPFFHLSVAPVLLSPFPLALVDRLIRPRGENAPSLAKLVALGVGVAAGLALLLGAALATDLPYIRLRAERGTITLPAVEDAALFLAGTWNPWLLTAMAALVAVGAVRFWRRGRGLALYFAALLLLPELSIAITRPNGTEWGFVIARYCLLAALLLLWLLALGLSALEERVWRRWPSAGALPVIAWCAIAFHLGPLEAIDTVPNNWTATDYTASPRRAAGAYRKRYWRQVAQPSSYYVELGKLPRASLNLIEAPWYFDTFFDPYAHYQRIHHQRTAIGFIGAAGAPTPNGELAMSDQRFRFRHFVHVLDQAGLCERKIDRVIFHYNLDAEMPPHEFQRSIEVGPLVEQYRIRYGPPLFEDRWVVVFDPSKPCREHVIE